MLKIKCSYKALLIPLNLSVFYGLFDHRNNKRFLASANMEQMFSVGFLLSLMTILSAKALYNPRNDDEVYQRESENHLDLSAPDFYQRQQFDYESARSNPRYFNFKRSRGFPQMNQFDNQYHLNPIHRGLIGNENYIRREGPRKISIRREDPSENYIGREDPREINLGKKSLNYDERNMFEPLVPYNLPNKNQDQKEENKIIEKDAAPGKSETLLKDNSEKNQSLVINKELIINKDSTEVLNRDSITSDVLRDSIIQGVVDTVMNREDETVKSVISDELIRKVQDFVKMGGSKKKEINDAKKITEKKNPDIESKEIVKDQINKNQQNLPEIKDFAANNTEKLDSKESSDKFENLFSDSKRDINPEVKVMYREDANPIKKEKQVPVSDQLDNFHLDNYNGENESDNNDIFKERSDLKMRNHRKPMFIRERDEPKNFMSGSRQQRRKDFERRRFQQNEVNDEDEDEEYQNFGILANM